MYIHAHYHQLSKRDEKGVLSFCSAYGVTCGVQTLSFGVSRTRLSSCMTIKVKILNIFILLSSQTFNTHTMQIPHLFFASSTFLAVGRSAFENPDPILFSDASRDVTLFQNENLADRPIESPLDFFLDDNDWWSSLTELDPNLSHTDNGGWESGVLFADQDDPKQRLGTESSFLLGSDFGCDISDAENTSLFGKVRRRKSCPVPFVGQAENPDQSKHDPNAPSSGNTPRPNSYAAVLNEFLFRNPTICPSRVFGLSNIPVCKLDAEVDDFEQVGVNVFNIRDVIPRMSLYNLFSMFYAIDSSC